MLTGPERTIKRARKLRGDMTLPEVMLWRALRKRPDGLKFRRQHASGPYVAEFFCHEARLVVEVDGMAHDMGCNPVRDEARDGWFFARGMTVLRIAASDVLADVDMVVRGIVARALTSVRYSDNDRNSPPPMPPEEYWTQVIRG